MKRLKPPTNPSTLPTGTAIVFADEHQEPNTWKTLVLSHDGWLRKAFELLRAANLLHPTVRNVNRQIKEAHPYVRASVDAQAFMLGAMAIECALKSYILAHVRVRFDGTELPEMIKGHNLIALLSRANENIKGTPLAPGSKAEEDVINQGEALIAYAGRYPTTLRLAEHPRASSWRPAYVIPACNGFVWRIVERIVTTDYNEAGPNLHAQITLKKYVSMQRRHFQFVVSPVAKIVPRSRTSKPKG